MNFTCVHVSNLNKIFCTQRSAVHAAVHSPCLGWYLVPVYGTVPYMYMYIIYIHES